MEKTEMAKAIASGVLDEYESELERLEEEGLLDEKERIERLHIPNEGKMREICLEFAKGLCGKSDIENLGYDELYEIGRGLFYIGSADDRDSFRKISEDMSISKEMIDIMEKGVSLFDFSKNPPIPPKKEPEQVKANDSEKPKGKGRPKKKA